VWREYLDFKRRTLSAGHRELASALAPFGLALLKAEQFAEAEPVLRECLSIRDEKLVTDDWLRFNTRSMLGGALAGQGKYDQAEPLLLDGYAGMKDNPAAPANRKRQALQRIVDLYEVSGKSQQAAMFRAELEDVPDAPAP
jgi:hypothetical protein